MLRDYMCAHSPLFLKATCM